MLFFINRENSLLYKVVKHYLPPYQIKFHFFLMLGNVQDWSFGNIKYSYTVNFIHYIIGTTPKWPQSWQLF